jgi:3',5'-cyclic AMP phosphodiesterase CpdA
MVPLVTMTAHLVEILDILLRDSEKLLPDKYRIKFVVVTGDITDSGERSEFLKAKEILDSLRIPYIPVIGNHDIWPHTSSSESKYPTGDRYFKKVFANNFKKLKALFPGWNDGTRNRAIWNGECDSLIRKDAGCYSYFQNFAFDYAGYHFIFADFVGRDHAIFGYKGAMPDADLSDSKKVRGTWSWFKNHLKKYPNKGSDNVLIFAHHPLTKYDAGVMTFSSKEYNAVTSYLNKYKYSVGGWFAGHFHYNRVYNIKTWWWSTISPGHETAVLKESPKSGPGGDKGGKVLHREFNSKIVRVWGKSQNSNPSGVTFYEHTWYRGRKEVFVADDPDLRNNYIGNDKISSLRIGSCKVTLYEHKNYRGKSITFTKDVPDLTKYIAKKSWWRKTTWNDLTSSVKVVC